MELTLPLLPYLLTSLLLLLSVRFLQKRVTDSKSKLPPGPWALPFIGSLHHLATGVVPHRVLRDLARLHGPIMYLRIGQVDHVVISSREAAVEVLKTQDAKLSNRPVTTAGDVLVYGSKDVVYGNGSHWRMMRRICKTELLISNQVKSFSSIRQKEIISLLKSFSLVSDKSPVNLSEKTSKISNNIIYHATFGCMDNNSRQVFMELFRDMMECFSSFGLSDLFPSLSWLDVNMKRRLERLRCKLDALLEDVLKEHLENREQQKKAGDEELRHYLVDILINIKEHGNLEEPITMDNIKAVILDVFVAGTETTSATEIWAMTELIRHPEVMRKVQTEIRQATRDTTKIDENALGYLKLVIKETLRMHPPGPLLVPRICNESCQILGYTIPSGAHLLVNAFALGRNPEYWNDPEEFRPERFEMSSVDYKGKDYEYIPFGSGRRICPGIDFGLAVTGDTLARLLLHFDWELPDGMKPEDLDMTETFGISAVKKEPLCLVPTLRVPLPEC